MVCLIAVWLKMTIHQVCVWSKQDFMNTIITTSMFIANLMTVIMLIKIINFGQIHLSILSHPKLNFASSSFPFFAQPKHFAFLAPSIKLTLVVTTLQRWLIYWKKPLTLPLPCPLLFVANASVICCHCHCYLLFQILTFLVTEGSLMAKGLHQGLLGTIK